MNLKRTLVSALAATTLVLSLAAPVALADDTKSTNAEVDEAGSLYSSFSNNVAFGVADISTFGDPVTLTELPAGYHHPFKVNDSRTSSPGYTFQISATDLTNGSFSIAKGNLQIKAGGGNGPLSAGYSCLAGSLRASHPIVGGNDWQTVELDVSSSTWTPLTGTTDLITGGVGRGCGGIGPSGNNSASGGYQANFQFQLSVPAGTATGIYTGSITVTELGVEPT